MSKLNYALGALCGMALTAGSASAATVDFTDDDFVNGGFNAAAGTIVTVSASGGALTATPFDGDFAPNDLLAFDTDGFGILDDEVTDGDPDEVLRVDFGAPVSVSGFYFLDLFEDPNSEEHETAFVAFDGGPTLSFEALELFQANAGFAFFMLDAPITTTGLAFTAGSENDGVAEPDFAVAGLEVDGVAPVPLPAAAWLLLGALGGLGMLSRRRAE